MTMKLLGVTRLDQLGPHLVSPSILLDGLTGLQLNTKALDPLIADTEMLNSKA